MARVFDVTQFGTSFDAETSEILRLLTLPVLPLQYADSLRKTEPERVPTTVPLRTVTFHLKTTMWNQNFMFRFQDNTPLPQSENELFHDTDPALDSEGLKLEKFISVWIQGDEAQGTPTAYTNIYVRTATLDFNKRAGFLQPIQGRSHQIKQILSPGQKAYLRDWLSKTSPQAWDAAEDHFKVVFEAD